MSISMYFGVSWLDPRLNINDSAIEWREVKTGPKDVRFFRDTLWDKIILGFRYRVWHVAIELLPTLPQGTPIDLSYPLSTS